LPQFIPQLKQRDFLRDFNTAVDMEYLRLYRGGNTREYQKACEALANHPEISQDPCSDHPHPILSGPGLPVDVIGVEEIRKFVKSAEQRAKQGT